MLGMMLPRFTRYELNSEFREIDTNKIVPPKNLNNVIVKIWKFKYKNICLPKIIIQNKLNKYINRLKIYWTKIHVNGGKRHF